MSVGVRRLAARRRPKRHQPTVGAGAIDSDASGDTTEPLFGVARRPSVALGERAPNEALLADLHEVVAGKLGALIDRNAARDLFTARRILEAPDLDWPLIRVGVLAYGASRAKD